MKRDFYLQAVEIGQIAPENQLPKEQVNSYFEDTEKTKFRRAKNLIAWLIRIGQIKEEMPTDQQIKDSLEKTENKA